MEQVAECSTKGSHYGFTQVCNCFDIVPSNIGVVLQKQVYYIQFSVTMTIVALKGLNAKYNIYSSSVPQLKP